MVHGFALAAGPFVAARTGACAVAGVSQATADRAPTASTQIDLQSRRLIGVAVLLDRFLAKEAIHQLFDELDAFELAEPRILVHVPVSGMLIFHGRVKTLGSVIVASY